MEVGPPVYTKLPVCLGISNGGMSDDTAEKFVKISFLSPCSEIQVP